jgi:hypothetical protein
MYNLIVGFVDDVAWGDRMLEYTEPAIRQWVTTSGTPYGAVDLTRLESFPTLVMPELQDTHLQQVARDGKVEHLTFTGLDYRFRFVRNPAVPAIASDRVERASQQLGIIEDFEFNHHHWAVKDVDLYKVLHESILSALAPKLFRLPLEIPTERDLVAVMIPFDARFDTVYETLQQAVAESGMRCYRADDIWLNDQIMDDIINLIWRARVVIADFTLKNPNVFYETGIAHMLGRTVIQITQSLDYVPFDLRQYRSVEYLPNGEGLAGLKAEVVGRLKYLATAS